MCSSSGLSISSLKRKVEMDNLVIERADLIKQTLASLRVSTLPWSLQWAQRSVSTYVELPTKFLKKLTLQRRSKRHCRIEAIERNASVIMALCKYTDLSTMQVGVPKETGAFLGLTYRFIAKKIGWRTDEDDTLDKALIAAGKRPRERGVKRVARAIKELKAAGYLSITPKSKMHDNGSYEGIAAIKRVSSSLFYDLGVSVKQLKKCCEQAKRRMIKKKEQYQIRLLGAIRATLPMTQKKNKHSRKAHDDIASRKAKLQSLQRIRMMPENTHLSSGEFYLKYPSLKPDR